MRDTEMLRERLQTMDQVAQYVGEYFSREWVMKNVMRMSDDDIKQMQDELSSEGPKEDDTDQDDN